MSNDSDGFNFLTSVSSVELQGSNKSFDNWAKCLSEFFTLISSSCVGDKDLRFSGCCGNIVDEAGICDLTSND